MLVRLRILPTDVGIGSKDVLDSTQKRLPSGMEIRRAVDEPIAFGLVASIVDIIIEEREGEMDRLEESLRSSELVSQVEVMAVSRLSTRIG
ncbi:MAG: elongation factor 1-beta [Nitrososphaerales archaeon]